MKMKESGGIIYRILIPQTPLKKQHSPFTQAPTTPFVRMDEQNHYYDCTSWAEKNVSLYDYIKEPYIMVPLRKNKTYEHGD